MDLKGVHSAVYDVTGVEPVRLRAQLSVRWLFIGILRQMRDFSEFGSAEDRSAAEVDARVVTLPRREATSDVAFLNILFSSFSFRL